MLERESSVQPEWERVAASDEYSEIEVRFYCCIDVEFSVFHPCRDDYVLL